MAIKSKQSPAHIAGNKKAYHDYFIEQKYEAGIVLQGWEAKSLRAGKVQIKEAYVVIKSGEIFLVGCHISALLSASTHVRPDNIRTKKLLMHRSEIDQLTGAIDRKGYTLVPLNIYWKNGRAKLEIGLAKGKKDHDKRSAVKDREWGVEKGRIMRENNRYS